MACPNEDLHSIPTFSEIRDITLQRFQKRPCIWQIKVAHAILQRKKDVISIAGTGMGKTLTFWMPLLASPAGSMQIIVTPLNILGKQNVETLAKAGLKGVFINADSATTDNFRAIENLEYQAVVVNPEQLMKAGGGFERLFKNKLFTSRIVGIIFDEAHCISSWGSFRPEYKDVGKLRYMLPKDIPFVVTSATLPPLVLQDVISTLQLRQDSLLIFRKSIDRSNIQIVVQKIINSLSSFEDLKFLVQDWEPGGPAPPKFLVFFDSINEAIAACKYIKSLLPKELQDKVAWFCSDMSNSFKDAKTADLENGDMWGLFTTDSFGMGMDIQDILIIVQWRATCSMATLWQRLGRAGRRKSIQATAVFLVEKEYFDEERQLKEQRKRARHQKATSRFKRPGLTKRISARMQDLSNVDVNSIECDVGDDDTTDDSDIEAELLTRYHTHDGAQRKRKRGQKAGRELEPAMDDLINADVRGLRCRRNPVCAHFANGKAGARTQDRSPGRFRAEIFTCIFIPLQTILPQHATFLILTLVHVVTVAPIDICCDICNPTLRDRYSIPVTKRPKRPARSRIKKFDMGPADVALKSALDDWRDEKTRTVFGEGYWNDLGPCLVLPSEILDRIIECAHEFKITNVDDLVKETRWPSAKQYGQEILEIIRQHSPHPAPVLTVAKPLPNRGRLNVGLGSNSVTETTQREKQRNKCRACGRTGHNARNRLCPKYSPPSTFLATPPPYSESFKENEPLPSPSNSSMSTPSLSTVIPPSVFYAPVNVTQNLLVSNTGRSN